MFDRRLMRELKFMKAFWMKVTAVAIVVVTLTILQGQKLASLIDALIIQKINIRQLLPLVVFLAAVMIAKSISGFIYEYMNRRVAILIKENLRRRVADHIIDLGPVRLKDEASGALSGVVQTGVDQLEPYFSEFVPQLVMVMVSTVMVLITVMSVDWISGVIMLVTVPFIPVFMILIGKMATNVNQQQWKKLQQMNGHFLDVLRGLPTLRLFGRIKRQAQIVAQVNEAFRETTMKVLRISFLSALVLELVATISTALVSVSLGIRLLYGRIDFYSAFFILLMAPEYYQPIRQLGAKFHAAMGSRAAADGVYAYLNREDTLSAHHLKETVVQKIDHSESDHLESGNATSNNFTSVNSESFDSLSIEKLSFGYDPTSLALNSLSMKIEKGMKVALVGPSGSGKSTFVGILLGFINDYEGTITLGEKSKKVIDSENWNQCFAYVPQNPKLFKGNLRENLSLSSPELNDETLISMIDKIGLFEWFNTLPQGLETYIGEGGINLSGGQTQLIAIGRALLKGAPILIMDEPTSAMDVQTEENINRVLDVELKEKTVIVIAHRLSTIARADRVFYLESGVILESGSHHELLERKGAFYHSMPQWGGGL